MVELGVNLSAQELVKAIHALAPKDRKVKIMNVCGSHEHTITHSGMRALMPETIELVPGPGCPVCVCSESDVINAINLSKRDDTILCTYGDMLRVPTRIGSIRSNGGNYKMVSAPHEVLKIAEQNPDKNVVFFSIGFETTTAPTAALLEMGVPDNFYLLTSQKLTPEIMELLVKDSEVGVDAFVAPGHVSTIVGANAWRVFPEKYGIPTVVAGFEPENLLLAIARILLQLKEGRAELENVYKGVVKPEGNKRAQELMYKYFYKTAVNWRGIGYIPDSGLELRPEYNHLNAKVVFNLPEIQEEKIPGCICDRIVLGKAYPTDCKLFGKGCTPRDPKGPCMVSMEGACNIWYRFGR
ncbi:hydrogenase expression/formation protein HypD [Thermovibrio ammonificans HB-1]|uniref:Hydrogenase expression/formation protein HypD n=1 Tax=Thermovibrio ammonificans (strain DSM 15698 / JCM 12110 / HB-1) TaxID=648996 RepID=E8T1Z6_THEA1|nr:hydrogenase formation protein HypD [Thermovibrio ammonificans]ADU96891.1 hydrogenase expression/formation protein HypD [Thermovibrio ammonificans HB-1]